MDLPILAVSDVIIIVRRRRSALLKLINHLYITCGSLLETTLGLIIRKYYSKTAKNVTCLVLVGLGNFPNLKTFRKEIYFADYFCDNFSIRFHTSIIKKNGKQFKKKHYFG